MSRKLVSALAIAPRRRLVASAIVYGLSLAIRFTSATGEEMEVPPQAVQSAGPMTSIRINDSAQVLYRDWPQTPAQSIGFPRWVLGSKGCGAACEGPFANSGCSPPP